jgi:AAA15 family ATPase/GTPase
MIFFKKVTIKNYMGIPDLALVPGSFNLISGRNGYGKSSIISAIRAVGEHEHDPARIRNGSEFAEVAIELSNGYVLKMRTRAKGTTWTFSDEKGHEIKRSAEFIQSIVDSLSLDPTRFLKLKTAEQLKVYQSAMPLRLTTSDLLFVPVDALVGIDLEKHALDIIGDKTKGIYGRLYEQRTELNRTAKTAKTYAEKLSESLPEDAPAGNWSDEYQAKTSALALLNSETKLRADSIRKDCADVKTATEDIYAKAESRLDTELAEAIKALETTTAAEKKRAAEVRDAKIAAAQQSRDAALESAKADYDPKSQALSAEIQRAKTMIEQHAKAEATRELIADQRHISGDSESKADQITETLEKLEAKRLELIAASPIPGLEVTDGELALSGVPLRIVNKAEQIRIAIEIAKLRQGECGVVIVDDAEHMDSENMDIFKQAALASGLQYFVARVEDCELQVTEVA